MLVIVILFLCLSLGSTYSITTQITQDVANVQVGTLECINNDLNGTSMQKQFFLTFNYSYSNPPYLMLALHTYFFCPGGAFHNFRLINGVRNPLGILLTVVFHHFDQSTDLNNQIKLNYFLLSSYSKSIQLHYQQGFNNNAPFEATITFTMGNLLLANTLYACFMMNVFVPAGTLWATLKVDGSCSATASDQLTFYYTNTMDLGNVYHYHFYSVAFYQDAFIEVIHFSAFFANDFSVKAMPSLPTDPDAMYFIGLIGFETTGLCVKSALSPDQLQLSTDSNTYLSIYRYFVFKFKQCKVEFDFKTTYSPFRSVLELEYGNFCSPHGSGYNFTAQFWIDFTYMNTVGVIQFQANNPISLAPYTLQYSFSASPIFFYIKFQVKMIVIERIGVNCLANEASFNIINIENVSLNHFSFNSTKIHKQSIFNAINNVYLGVRFEKSSIEEDFYVDYENTANKEKARNIVRIPVITRMETSAFTRSCSVYIQGIKDMNSSTHQKLNWTTTNINEAYFFPLDNGTVKGKFKANSSTIQESFITFTYTPDPSTSFMAIVSFAHITVSTLQLNTKTKEVIITLLNTQNILSHQLSEFNIHGNGPVKKSTRRENGLIVLVADSQNYTGDEFYITFSSESASYTASILLQYDHLFNVSYDSKKNKLNITLTNHLNFTSPAGFIRKHSIQALNITDTQVTSDNVTFQFEFSELILNKDLSITIQPQQSLYYKQIITIPLEENLELLYCPRKPSFDSQMQMYFTVSGILSAAYLTLFALSIFSCQKMFGIELMYVIQLGYYSLIPINIYCDPLPGLEGLKYASGSTSFVGDILNLPQSPILSNYSSMGISSNFLTNVNVIIVILLFLPLISIPLMITGNKSTHYRTKPRCLKYGKAFLCQVPLTILLFISPSICTSFIVNLQTSGTTNIIPLTISVLCVSLLPLTAILFLKFQNHFIEFRTEFNTIDPLFKLSQKTSSKIRQYYPFLIILQVTLVPLVISIKQFFGFSLYIALAVEVVITIFVCLSSLYLHKFQNIRIYGHRVLILAILGIQVIAKSSSASANSPDSFLFSLPLLLLIVISLGLLWTGSYIMYKSIKFWRSPSLIIDSLRIKQKNLRFKPQQEKVPERASGLWIPRNWYDIKQKIKSQRINNPPKQNQQQYSTFAEMYQMWFKEIGDKRLFEDLGVDQKMYNNLLRANISNNDKQYYMKQWLKQADVQGMLLDPSTKIQTLCDLLNCLSASPRKRIKASNSFN